jgi:hypothetical protein
VQPEARWRADRAHVDRATSIVAASPYKRMSVSLRG